MQNSFKYLKGAKQLCKEFKIWLNSQEFKEKYLNTKHPYPPLLNPEMLNDENSPLNYSNIPAEMAWELNLPLPNYDFLCIASGAAGSGATWKFLQNCKVNVNDAISCKDLYTINYNTFLAHKDEKNCFFCYCYYILATQDSPKMISLFRKKPLFFIIRDPIERLQHAINHLTEWGHNGLYIEYKNAINLTCDYNFLFKPLTYEGYGAKPNLGFLDLDVSYKLNKLSLYDTSAINALKDKTNSIYLVEFNDLKPDKAFDTFCKLADNLVFERPANKEIFTNRVNRSRGNALIALPVIFYVHSSDLPNVFKEGKKERRNLASIKNQNSIKLIITLPHYLDDEQKGFVDIIDEIEPNLIINDTKILVILSKDDLSKLKENTELFEATKDYLRGYINTLKDIQKEIKSSLINEKQILEYLRQNGKARKSIKGILDNELSYIKTHHPEFIQKWKHYLEFEKMCKELDSTQNKG